MGWNTEEEAYGMATAGMTTADIYCREYLTGEKVDNYLLAYARSVKIG